MVLIWDVAGRLTQIVDVSNKDFNVLLELLKPLLLIVRDFSHRLASNFLIIVLIDIVLFLNPFAFLEELVDGRLVQSDLSRQFFDLASLQYFAATKSKLLVLTFCS